MISFARPGLRSSQPLAQGSGQHPARLDALFRTAALHQGFRRRGCGFGYPFVGSVGLGLAGELSLLLFAILLGPMRSLGMAIWVMSALIHTTTEMRPPDVRWGFPLHNTGARTMSQLRDLCSRHWFAIAASHCRRAVGPSFRTAAMSSLSSDEATRT